jgi:hypothetical protein
MTIYDHARVSTDGRSIDAQARLNARKETQGDIAHSYNASRWTIARLGQWAT